MRDIRFIDSSGGDEKIPQQVIHLVNIIILDTMLSYIVLYKKESSESELPPYNIMVHATIIMMSFYYYIIIYNSQRAQHATILRVLF